MKAGALDEGSVASSDRRTIGTAKGENNGTTARVAADGKPLRSERGIREVERNVFRVRVSTGSRDPLTGSPKQIERVIRVESGRPATFTPNSKAKWPRVSTADPP